MHQSSLFSVFFLLKSDLCVCINAMCGNAFGYMVGATFSDIKVASAVAPMIFVPLMLFSGYFINRDSMIQGFELIQYISVNIFL